MSIMSIVANCQFKTNSGQFGSSWDGQQVIKQGAAFESYIYEKISGSGRRIQVLAIPLALAELVLKPLIVVAASIELLLLTVFNVIKSLTLAGASLFNKKFTEDAKTALGLAFISLFFSIAVLPAGFVRIPREFKQTLVMGFTNPHGLVALRRQ